jgi:hypothetical protein
MQPYLTTPEIIESYLEAEYWSRETMLDRFRQFSNEYPEKIACRDSLESFS